MQYGDIVAGAEQVLSETLGCAVALDLSGVCCDYAGAPSTVLRCRVSAAGPAAPRTVVVKRVNGPKAALRREAAGLLFVAARKELRGLAPVVYGMNPAASLLVMEDLQAEQDDLLGNILFGADSALAESALVAFGRSLGRLHAGTAGREPAYRELCRRYSVRGRSRHRVHALLSDLAAFGALLESAGARVSARCRDEIRAARDAIARPGAFLTFVHGDATPANAFYRNSEIRLFDLEASGFRHALLDGSFARIRYLHSVWARGIPSPARNRVEAAYRSALVDGCPEAADDGCFYRALGACSAAWLAGICAHLPGVRERDRRWGRATLRQRIIAALEHFADLGQTTAVFPALTGAVLGLGRHLRREWPEPDCILQPYPALVAPPESAAEPFTTGRRDGWG